MDVLKRVGATGASVSLIVAVTALLFYLQGTVDGADHLVFFYLLPVILIATVYNGRLAIACAVLAAALADYFLQDPLYSFLNDNPLEYGDLLCFAAMAMMAVKCVRLFLRPQTQTSRPRVRRA